ncbi:hypothetical protein [Haladaptatus sp. NG-SE-30]
MHWTKPLALLGVAVLVGLALGGLALLVTTTLSEMAAIVTMALVAVFVAGLALVGAKSKQWRANPYW